MQRCVWAILLLAGVSRADERAELLKNPTADRCRQFLGVHGDADRCAVAASALGRATVIKLIGNCYGDSCDVQTWIVDGRHGARRLPDSVDAGIAVAPSLELAVADRAERLIDRWEVFLQRIDLTSDPPRQGSRFADCMSPVLSPAGRWFVCRDRRGNVLRVPVDGGHLALVHRNSSVKTVQWVPHASLYPGEVEFLSRTRMRIRTCCNGDEAATEEIVEWRE